MKEIVIDCTAIDSRESFHSIFAQALAFPAWYGKNLDALHDCLTAIHAPTRLRLQDWDVAEIRLGDYGARAKTVIATAGFENTDLEIIF